MLFLNKSYLYSKHIILRSLVKLKLLYLKDYRELLFEELKLIKSKQGLNILEIGPTNNPTTINQKGISVSGENLIKKDSDGNIHIGKNSFVIGDDVLNGAHPIWAEDDNDNKILINSHLDTLFNI